MLIFKIPGVVSALLTDIRVYGWKSLRTVALQHHCQFTPSLESCDPKAMEESVALFSHKDLPTWGFQGGAYNS